MQANTKHSQALLAVYSPRTAENLDLGLVIDNNDAASEELRHHIHHLLRDYSRTHFTTDYIDFTEDLVSEVWISLFYSRFLVLIILC